jgi:D-alanyl-D-alanine carboxypeptidase/D-alanyl-D-alanine-endopeptidase (penicillin-binding protein 4)
LEKTKITRLENENEFGITYPEQNEGIDDEIPFKYSETLMLQLLQDTLERDIIYIKKKPECETRIFHSQPADSVFRRMLLVSDNFIAEQILLMGAYNLFDTLNSNKMIDFARENWLPELDNGSRWKDGSGLSRYNQFSPNDMIVVLSKLFRTISTQRLFELMPHGNELKFSGNEDDDAYLIAKTGSMSYVYNLSGFMKTRSGKILIFSFMNNNFTISTDIIQGEMARVLEAFRRKY